MSEPIPAERWILRIGGGAAIAGALLGLVGNLAHPATPVADPDGLAKAIAESPIWVPIHLGIVLGLILMLGGLVAVHHSIRGGIAGALARFGFVAAIVGVGVGLLLVALDGFALKQLAESWAGARPEEKVAAALLVQAEETMNFALLSLFNLLFAGVTFLCYGLAVALSAVYPRWLGWIVVVAAFGGMAAGVIQAFAGESNIVTAILGIGAPTVITLWLVVMGVLLVRRSAAVAAGSAIQPEGAPAAAGPARRTVAAP
jgi:hypothetical protein